MAEIRESTALQATEDKLTGQTYLGQTIGTVRAFQAESYRYPQEEALFITSNPYNCLWEIFVDEDSLSYETVQVGAQRRKTFSMRVRVTMRRQSTDANRSLFHVLCEQVLDALAHSDWQGMGLGVPGSGTQNEGFRCRYQPMLKTGKSVTHKADITFRLFNAAVQT